MFIPKQVRAARDIEELSQAIPEIVRLLREGQSPENAYALAYELRTRLGRVVANLGAGAPLAEHRRYAEDAIDSQIQSLDLTP